MAYTMLPRSLTIEVGERVAHDIVMENRGLKRARLFEIWKRVFSYKVDLFILNHERSA